jgi:hypothetical protein
MNRVAAVAVLLCARAAFADPGDGSSSGSNAELDYERKLIAYQYDHEEHVDRAHKRFTGHVELLLGAVLAIGGTALFVHDPHAGTPAAIGGGLGLAGICTFIVGTITTIQGADPDPVIPMPTPPGTVVGRTIGAQWAWTF